MFNKLIICLIGFSLLCAVGLMTCSSRAASGEDERSNHSLSSIQDSVNLDRDSIPQDYGDSRFDPRAADFSWLFEEPEFVLAKWDSTHNEGYGVLNTGELFYLKSWSGDQLGMSVKILKNEPPRGISEKSVAFWLDECFRYSGLVLNKVDLADVKLSIQEENYWYENSAVKLVVNSDTYSEFLIWAKEMDMETVVIQVYYDREY